MESGFRGWRFPRDLSTASASQCRRREGRTWPTVAARFPAATARGCRGQSVRCRSMCRRCVAACPRYRRSFCWGGIASRCLASPDLRIVGEPAILTIDRRLLFKLQNESFPSAMFFYQRTRDFLVKLLAKTWNFTGAFIRERAFWWL